MYRMTEFRKEDSLLNASDEDHLSTSEVEEDSSIDASLLDDMDG